MADKFTVADLQGACDDLSMLPFFPIDAKASVIRLLAAMCPHREALRWVVVEAVANCPQWPGPAELRALLCTKYRPADGIMQDRCSILGHTAAEAEQRYLLGHEKIKRLESSYGGICEEGWFFKDLSNMPDMIAKWQAMREFSNHPPARVFARKLLAELSNYMGEEL